MLLRDAKALRNEIKTDGGLHCIVPLGHGPDGYFARIYHTGFGNTAGPVDFYSRETWIEYHAEAKRKREEILNQRDAVTFLPPPRSPIEMMIDRACGLA